MQTQLFVGVHLFLAVMVQKKENIHLLAGTVVDPMEDKKVVASPLASAVAAAVDRDKMVGGDDDDDAEQEDTNLVVV